MTPFRPEDTDLPIAGAFTWLGQPVAEWPRWLVAKNYAASPSQLKIHRLDDVLVVPRGRTVALQSTRDVILLP